jgi:hypothetical protein
VGEVSRGGGSAAVGEVHADPPPREDWHGTRHGYVTYRCRCDDCRRANTEYRREQRATARTAKPREDWHGKLSGYTLHKCRCPECRQVHADYQHTNRGYKTRRGENMPSDFPGLGVLRCGLCDRPYVEHALTDRCYP